MTVYAAYRDKVLNENIARAKGLSAITQIMKDTTDVEKTMAALRKVLGGLKVQGDFSITNHSDVFSIIDNLVTSRQTYQAMVNGINYALKRAA